MSERSRRPGRRTLPRAQRRNIILPAPGFLPVEYGVQVELTPREGFPGAILFPRPGRPSRPQSGFSGAGSVLRLWRDACRGPSVN